MTTESRPSRDRPLTPTELALQQGMTTEFRPDKNGYPTPAELAWRQAVCNAGPNDYPLPSMGTITNFREAPVGQG